MSEVSTPPEIVVPASVKQAIRMIWVVVALTGVIALLTIPFRDELVRSWAQGNPEAEGLIASGGVAALDASSIIVPAFAPLAISLFVTFAGLMLVLVPFFRGGHNSARITIAALMIFGVFAAGVSIARGLPVVFVVLALVTLVAFLVELWLLFHQDTKTFVTTY